MARALIAVVTCRNNLDTWVKAIRETWLDDVSSEKADVRFFVGRRAGVHDTALHILPSGVVALDCADEYGGLPEKVRAITRWASPTYDFMLKCDDDTVLFPDKALTSGYEQHDYSGRSNRPGQYPYDVPFGFNYWLSKHCMKIIAESPLPHDFDDERWVAEMLYDKGVRLHNEQRYMLHQDTLPPRGLRVVSNRAPSRLMKPLVIPKYDYVARNIYMACSLEDKLEEFRKVYVRYR